jgi:3-hydroxyisobutyrate dehydrogenase-like beta-hydroxyacid dehydrogenase
MGRPTVSNLLKDGHTVRVFNRTVEKARPLADEGAILVERPEEVVEPGGILMTCLANDQALEGLFEANPGLLERLGPESVHVSMSTIAPETARRLTQGHAEHGTEYVAAPVMGRPEAVAERAQLYLVAGPTAAVGRVGPILESIGRRVFGFGEEPAMANVAKLAMNFLIASATEAMSEAFTLAKKSGLDPADLYGLFAETLFACPIYRNYGRLILDGNYREPSFRLALGLKDMALVAQHALETQVPMPLASLLRDRYLRAMAHGRGEWDWIGIAAEVEADAGL